MANREVTSIETPVTAGNLSAGEHAAKLGIKPKAYRAALRKMLNSDAHAGRGNKYVITPEIAAEIELRLAKTNRKEVTVSASDFR